jgi:predicted small lipoprotein YifL
MRGRSIAYNIGMRTTLLALLLGLCLPGCGLKGPLYLPTAEERRELAEREQALKEREARERTERAQPPPRPAPPPPTDAPASPQ